MAPSPPERPRASAGARGARLLPYAVLGPCENMGVDEAVLHLADRPTLRFYGWSPPAVSLGRFQRDRAALAGLLRSGLPVVRRMTGGGAIVHWHELTYALFLPTGHPSLAGCTTRASYHVLHGPILSALRSLGADVGERRVAALEASPRGELLCFHRVTDLDLVAGGRKLVGSAQRRLRDGLLQHGSIVLARNPLQPGTAALEDLLTRVPPRRRLAALLTQAFEKLLGPLEPGRLSAAEESHAAKAAARSLFA